MMALAQVEGPTLRQPPKGFCGSLPRSVPNPVILGSFMYACLFQAGKHASSSLSVAVKAVIAVAQVAQWGANLVFLFVCKPQSQLFQFSHKR